MHSRFLISEGKSCCKSRHGESNLAKLFVGMYMGFSFYNYYSCLTCVFLSVILFVCVNHLWGLLSLFRFFSLCRVCMAWFFFAYVVETIVDGRTTPSLPCTCIRLNALEDVMHACFEISFAFWFQSGCGWSCRENRIRLPISCLTPGYLNSSTLLYTNLVRLLLSSKALFAN